MGQVTNSFITFNSRSCPELALTFIGEIFFISLTVSVSLARSIGTANVIRATDFIVPLSVIEVRSTGIVADVRATEDVDAAVLSILIVPLRIHKYLPIT